jgi:hypothetical protein
VGQDGSGGCAAHTLLSIGESFSCGACAWVELLASDAKHSSTGAQPRECEFDVCLFGSEQAIHLHAFGLVPPVHAQAAVSDHSTSTIQEAQTTFCSMCY